MKRQKYEPNCFDLSECKALLQVIPLGKQDPGYGVVFLNIQLPDGRWAAFKQTDGSRVAIYKPKVEHKKEEPKTA